MVSPITQHGYYRRTARRSQDLRFSLDKKRGFGLDWMQKHRGGTAMAKKILVALDESENAMKALDYVVRSFTPDHEVTLFNVALDTAAICDMNSPELTPYFTAQQIAFCSLEDKKKELVKKAMEEGIARLTRAGFQAGRVSLKMETRKKGIARDILAEAQSGYDTIVMGRRGLSGITEFFIGSVSQKVLNNARGISVVLAV
jgi:nucleotide-binding universal stress UspA family protein